MQNSVVIAGYELQERVYSDNNVNVYRGRHLEDNRNVILKFPKNERPTPKEFVNFQHEYQLLKKLQLPSVISAYELIQSAYQPVLVLEDVNGLSLLDYLNQRPVALNLFFQLSVQLVDIVASLHKKNIIHKDIKPSNIIINPETLVIKLATLSISSQLAEEIQDYSNPHHLEGTLAYISPEQTGRMNRSIDYRADFYSLGVTFFEMLTGQVPFTSKDTLELVYCHLAKSPALASAINPKVPIMLAKLVDKLMAKMPEDRYASALGLKADLMKCATEWQDTHDIAAFKLGQQEVHDRLHITNKLYGRLRQVETLLAAFDRISNGTPEVTLISGYSGVGKTSLVQEIYKPILRQKGYFIQGKFDQLERSTPYSAVIEALQGLVKYILSEPEETLQSLRIELQQALGHIGQVIIDVVPEVERIIGPQPALPELHPTEAQNRLNLAFKSFLSVFMRKEHPLVIFLDDLQWADRATLKLLQSIFIDPDSCYLLLIGAYRENMVDADHPLVETQEELERRSVPVQHLHLETLKHIDICHLLADTLNRSSKDVDGFAKLLIEKTQGNPFFINEFLKILYRDHLLKFSYKEEKWVWDLKTIQQQAITDNVASLLKTRIQTLSSKSQEILKLGSCIGHSFDLNTIVTISEESVATVISHLWEAVQANLIRPLGDQYKTVDASSSAHALDLKETAYLDEVAKQEKIIYRFNHDQIQQAVYLTIPTEIRQQTHLKIARLLEKQQQTWNANSESLFEVVDHFNQSLALLDDPIERLAVANYNLLAAKKAKDSSAHQAALDYSKAGISLLPSNYFESEYLLSLELHKELLECSYLTNRVAEAEEVFNLLLNNANNAIDKAKIYGIKIEWCATLRKYAEAIPLGVAALNLFNVNLPVKPTTFQVINALLLMQFKLKFRKISNLNLQLAEDNESQMVSELILSMINISYLHDQNLFVLLVLKGLNLSLHKGATSSTLLICICYAFILISAFNQVDKAFEFVELSNKLSKKIIDPNTLIKVRVISDLFIRHWRYPVINSLETLKKFHTESLELGDLSYANYSISMQTLIMYGTGNPLHQVLKSINSYESFATKNYCSEFFDLIMYIKKMISHLQNTTSREGAGFNDNNISITELESEFEKCISDCKSNTEKAILYAEQSKFYYLFNNYEKAFEMSKEGEKYCAYIKGSLAYTQHKTFYALALTANYASANKRDRRRYLKQLKKVMTQLARWTEWSKVNFQHYHILVSAEIAFITGDLLNAQRLYDEAIQAAEENGTIYMVAIANERAANFYLSLLKPHLAKHYHLETLYAYQRWGAINKCEQLKQQYPQYGITIDNKNNNMMFGMETTNATPELALDFMATLKSMQAISGEIQLDKLLQKLILIVLENAGAERCVLMVIHGKRLLVEAESTLEKQSLYMNKEVLADDRQDLPLTLIQYVKRSHETLVVPDAVNFEQALLDPYVQQRRPKSLLVLPILHHGGLRYILYLENNLTIGAFTSEKLQSLQMLASQAAISLENARLYSACDRFVPYAFLERLNRFSLVDVQLGDHLLRNMSILFCDIQNFTPLSEHMTPSEIFKLTSNFLGGMEPIIRQYHGFIDKYIGDAVMALFDDADDAVNAGILISNYVHEFNKHHGRNNDARLKVGIGINTGELILGVMGNTERMDCSVIGDPVNVASRVESLTRTYNESILITEETRLNLKFQGNYQLQLISQVPIKGKEKPTDLWRVNGCVDQYLDKASGSDFS